MTYGLLIINVAVYLLFELPYWANGGQGVRPFGFVPAQPRLGALLTSMFSHGSVMHLAGNMLYLWLFGSVAEDVLGPLLFLGFYFGGQEGATLLDVNITRAFAPAGLVIPRVGASGAVAGILGLSAVCFARVRVKVAYLIGLLLYWRAGVFRVPAWAFLGFWLAQQVLGGVLSTSIASGSGEATGGTACWAHIGGFAAGVAFAYILALPSKIRRHDLLAGIVYTPDESAGRYSDLNDLVRRSPQDAEAWLALGRSKESFGMLPDAAAAYARAAALFLEQREPERAGRAYQAVLRHEPAFTLPAAAQFDIAVGLTRAGEYRQALVALNNLLQAYPTSSEAEIALMRAGELAERLGERESALRYFHDLLQRYPYSAWADQARLKAQSLRR
jgi:membrane associated rhomboid family serine protease